MVLRAARPKRRTDGDPANARRARHVHGFDDCATGDRTVAGQLVSAVLPRYYDWGVVLCAVALTASAVLALSGRTPRWRALAGVALCGAMVCLLLWASIVVLPRAESARRARDDGAFALAHRSSVQLNGLTMLAGAAVLLLEAFSRPARRDR